MPTARKKKKATGPAKAAGAKAGQPSAEVIGLRRRRVYRRNH